MAPLKHATRTRKAADMYLTLGKVTFLAFQGVGRTGKWDDSGEWTHSGIAVHQVKVRSPRTAPTRLNLLVNLVRSYLPAFVRLTLQVVRRDADIVHVTGVPLLMLGVLHKMVHRSLLVVDVNERPASVSSSGSLFSAFSRVEPRLLRLGSRRADVTTVVTSGHGELLEEQYGYEDVITVRNAPLASWRSEFRPPPPRAPRSLRVVTVGTLFEGRGLTMIIEAVSLARSRGAAVELDIHGSGRADYAVSLHRVAASVGVINHVRFHGFISPELVSEAYLSAHIGLAIYEAVDAGNDSLSNKILECVSSGRPVLAGDLPENRRFIEAYGVGWLTAVTAEGIAKAFVSTANEGDLTEVATRCRLLGDSELTWEREFDAVIHRIATLQCAGLHAA